MSTEEFLDILDENGEKTGVAAPYKEAHEKGLIHRSVHVWFRNSVGELLIQKRTPNKAAYPNYWDISAAGHISAGETSIEAAKKETSEELGLFLSDEMFKLLFAVREYVVLNDGAYIANEFQDVYLVESDVEISQMKLQESEVAEVRWVSIPELQKWLKGDGEPIVPHQGEYTLLFKYLGTSD